LNAKLLQVICQLHEWESRNLDLATTQAGRYLYLNIAKQLQDNRSGPSAFLKGIYYNKDLSERALRYKIREFENDGLIEFETHNSDKRSKKILPTPALLSTVDDHVQEFSRMLSNEFLIFPKK
jgi:DNA-binding HxlR family transcriptional regulator